ncbi:SUKH-4 family immunity protein [Streptomyces sp. TLI_171]|uniref:SUKH-4 family immunity protein n=1 Tax=Streptomyces sp. TLI_171 TaxID=1938859 RepID=UPI000C17E65A|nr:SUKH-4 family immunity protein [Streptomyces sp. TLI_171]RKE20223.1 SUKH-4 immunity protein of toxin-antitoxin system [Streptomyces sp. TLI_171]
MQPVESLRPIRPVTRAELEQVYGVDGLRRVPATELPAVITDPAARDFLCEIGLPDAPSAIVCQVEPLLVGLPEACAPESPAGHWPGLPDGGAAMVVVGSSVAGTFALDGATGEVYALGAHQPPTVGGRPAHHSLHSLACCQLAFGGREMWTAVARLDQADIDWCRAHLTEFAELYPASLDEDGYEEDPETELPSDDEIFADLTAKLRAIEPGLLDQPVWQTIVHEFRHGY